MATQTIKFSTFPEVDGVKLFTVGSDIVVASGASVSVGANDPSAGTCTVTDVAAGLYKVVCFQGSTALSYQFVDLELSDGTFICRDTIEGDARISSRAAPGAEMALVDDAITASKYDETTAYPVKSADSGATSIARTGDDGDTLETLSDQLDTAQDDLDLITGDDGVTLATSQGKYAPAKAGAKMDLVDAPNAAAVTALQNGVSTFNAATDTVARVTLVDTCTENTDMRGTDDAITSLAGVASTADVEDAAQDVISAIPDVSGLALETTAQSIKTSTDKLDFTGSSGALKSESTNMRGTDNAITDISSLATAESLSDLADAVEEIDAHLDEQDVEIDDLIDDIAAVSAQVDGTLKPTVPGRTLNVEEDGTILTTTEVSEQSIREAMGLQEDQRVATPGDLAVNVSVGPATANVPPDISQSTIYLRLDDTSWYRVENVVDPLGNEIDFSVYESLELVFESRKKEQLEILTVTAENLRLINDGKGLEFQPSTLTVGTETQDSLRHLWAVRDPDDVGETGVGRVICGGDCVVRRFATHRS